MLKDFCRNPMLIAVSVVIPTFNERENVVKLIPLIRTALKGLKHEIIVVDDDSPDGTYLVAKELADVAISKVREGQTRAIFVGTRKAKFPVVVTIDADLENDPKHIPQLLERLSEFDVVVASREKLPRLSEKLFSIIFRERLGVTDILSNYRAFKKEVAENFQFGEKETYGAEFLIKAKKGGYKIGEIKIELIRRRNPRIGNALTANLKILKALFTSILFYLRNEVG